MNLRMAFCEALVDGWVSNRKMGSVIAHAYILAGIPYPENNADAYKEAEIALKTKHIYGAETTKVWIGKNMRNLNEALWAGRNRDACISCAQKMLKVGPRALTSPLRKNAREADKRHDWKTVK